METDRVNANAGTALEICLTVLRFLDEDNRKWVLNGLQTYPWPNWADNLECRKEATIGGCAALLNNFLDYDSRLWVCDQLEKSIQTRLEISCVKP